MADFNVRSDAVDVEQIMRQIRARIRDKRGVDYTEEQIQELARVKLEKFLDPRGVRSDLLEQFRQMPSGVPPTYAFDDNTLFQSDKAIVRFFRKLLRPFLKLLFNPNPLNQVLHQQVAINQFLIDRTARDVLFYEVVHNLVVEMTRTSIEVKNMKMRVESVASRLEFNERRARALEAVVQYRPESERRPADRDRRVEHRDPRTPQAGPPPAPGPVDPITGGDSLRSRRKRRRRGRRSGPGFGEPGELGAERSERDERALDSGAVSAGTLRPSQDAAGTDRQETAPAHSAGHSGETTPRHDTTEGNQEPPRHLDADRPETRDRQADGSDPAES